MTRVLVTGTTGFVGRVLCNELAANGYSVRAALRTPSPVPDCVAETVVTGEIHANTDWGAALAGVEVVVHLAASVHQPAASPELYSRVNSQGTGRLAQMAGEAGIRRFVYLSSIKVNGEQTTARAFRGDDNPAPQDPYGRSKLDAERALEQAAKLAGFVSIVVRVPLVYGPGVRANFLRLLEWVDGERPLPFGLIRNRRSLISVWNLCDLLRRTVEHPAAKGIWLASDGEDLSTPELVRRLAHALRRRARLLPMPEGVLTLAARLCGREADVRRLCGSLVVDASPARELLGWHAPLSVAEGLARTAAWYLTARAG